MGYDSHGELSIKLPQGPSSDSFKLYFTVSVIDDLNGITVYDMPSPVSVLPSQVLSNLTQEILNNDPNCEQLLQINSGNLNLIALNLISLVRTFNMELSNGVSLLSSQQVNKQSEFLEFLLEKVYELSISDTSSMNLMGSCLSELS